MKKLNTVPATMEDLKDIMNVIDKGVKVRDSMFGIHDEETRKLREIVELLGEEIETINRRVEELENKK